MAFQVMLVEDEPMILRYNRRIIEKYIKDFIIVATAENGEEALEYLLENHVDVVLTDVKMPVMDGIELIRNLEKKYPNIISIVLSGYQDFQYVRECMRHGCEDYLLKPLKEAAVKETFSVIKRKLDITNHNMLEQAFAVYIKYRKMDVLLSDWLQKKGKDYFLIILRNGYLNVTTRGKYLQPLEPMTFEKFAELELESHYICSGRFENEKVILLKKTELTKFYHILDNYNEGQKCMSYFTCTYDALVMNQNHLEELLLKLYYAVDEHIVIGQTNFFHYGSQTERKYTGINSKSRGRMIILLKGQQWEEFKNELILLFAQWEKENTPQRRIDVCIVDILSLVAGNISVKKQDFLLEAIEQMEEIYMYAKSISDVLFGLCDYLEDYLNHKSNYRMESEHLFLDIRNYIYTNIGDNIRLHDITEHFYISQTYVNRLFHKYAETSFYDFVLEEKIQEAQKIYEKSPNILTKDIALMLGFSDSSYFSKVFKSRKNISPSEYVKKLHS